MEGAIFYFVYYENFRMFCKDEMFMRRQCYFNKKKANKTQINPYKLQKFEVDKIIDLLLIRKGVGLESTVYVLLYLLRVGNDNFRLKSIFKILPQKKPF